MNRQKKEILKKIEKIENFIAVDTQLGCGFAPADFYAPLEQQIWELQEELARLSHYPNAMSMLMDERGTGELPF